MILGDLVYLASVVNLGMIWCFGFFFLGLLDDFDEKSNNDDALASLDDADRNWAAIPTHGAGANFSSVHFPMYSKSARLATFLDAFRYNWGTK